MTHDNFPPTRNVSARVSFSGAAQRSRSEVQAPPVPVIYEESELEKMSLRAYAAIHLRVPDSGVDWLDKMILKSRQLDRESS